MTDPTLVQSGEWVAAIRPDGGEQTFAEAYHAIRRSGFGFRPTELEQAFLCPSGESGYRECTAEDAGALAAWILRL